MTNETPLWRQAINDKDHPLNRAAWLLFTEKMNVKYADKVLSEQKDDVIKLMLLILDTPELYEEGSLGNGDAPINAISLLGHWQVKEAVPHLLRIIEDGDWDSIIYDRALVTLKEWGNNDILDEVFTFAQEADNADIRSTLCEALAMLGKGDTRVFEFIKQTFESDIENLWELESLAANLLTCDFEAGKAYLDEVIQQKKHPKDTREALQAVIVESRRDDEIKLDPPQKLD